MTHFARGRRPAAMWSVVILLGAASLSSVDSSAVCPHPPAVEFATFEPEKRVYQPGEHVQYSCKPGYAQRSGQRTIICHFSGLWNYVTMRCAVISCAYPGPLENGLINHTAMTFGSRITFSCNSGYILYGSAASECTETGKWSNALPVCEPVTCLQPAIPEFGKLKYYKPSPGNLSSFQDVVRFECLPKYAMFGNESATCSSNGNWSDIPTCVDVKCTRPTDIENGFMSFATIRMYHYLETVQYGCNNLYTLDGPRISRCEKTGRWSLTPTCKAPCKFPDKKGIVFYEQKVKLKDLKEKVMRHTESLIFFCKDTENDCGYTVPTQCIDGDITIPSCFQEPPWHSFLGTYTDPSDKQPCPGSH